MNRRVLSRAAQRALIVGALAAATIGSAGADHWDVLVEGVPPPVSSHMVALTDDEMADAHGGFEWGGMNISFGLDVRTYLDGQLALQNVVNWDANGVTRQTVVGSQATLVDMASSSGGAESIAIPANVSAGSTYLANAGRTVLIQNTNGALQNILINTMASLSAVQRTDATVTLGNYTAFAAALHAGAISASLGHEIATFSR